MDSKAGKASPKGGKKTTETKHMRVKANEATTTSTSDGSATSGIPTAY